MSDRLDDIRSRLESISEELADIALDALQAKVNGDDPGVDENRVTRARRAVVKAAELLG